MVITIIQERKKQRYLILAFTLIIFVILAVVWLGFFRNKEPIVSPSASATIYAIPEVDIDWQMLEDIRSVIFYPFKEISPLEGEFGRKNPFIPY